MGNGALVATIAGVLIISGSLENEPRESNELVSDTCTTADVVLGESGLGVGWIAVVSEGAATAEVLKLSEVDWMGAAAV
jgi:hypothetical protein